MSEHNLRVQSRPDYVALDGGATSDSAVEQAECSAGFTTPSHANVPSAKNSELDPSDLDLRIIQLQARKDLLVAEEKQAERLRIADELQREVDELVVRSEARVAAAQARGRSVAPPSVIAQPAIAPQGKRPVPVNYSASAINLRELRGFVDLNEKVDAELWRVGLGEEQLPREPQPLFAESTQTGKKLSTASGRDARLRDNVVHPIIWPHAALQYTFMASDITYNKLDFSLLVAGEASIIKAESTRVEEKLGRLNLLEKTAYHTKDYTWQACRSFHETALLEVERGVRTWRSKDYRDLEAGILYRHPLVQPGLQQRYDSTRQQDNNVRQIDNSRRQQSRRYFCLSFNKGECKHAGSHDGLLGRGNQYLEHFCSSCYRVDRSVKLHPEINCTQRIAKN